MTFNNSAAWIDAQAARIRVGPAETYKPGKDQVLVEIKAVAINPADATQQDTGLLIKEYPAIIGLDAAGTVVEVGEGATRISVGTRVLAFLPNYSSLSQAAFQKYAIASEPLICPIPDEMSYRDACVIPAALWTAITGLYGTEYLKLPYPTASPSKTGKTVLVWGGATSVAALTIQLAVASGVEVVTTASPRNFEYCKSLGAKAVLDYNGSTVVEDIVAALKETDCVGALEASGMDDAMKKTAAILSARGGGYMATARQPIKDLPSGVTAAFINGLEIEDASSMRAVWIDFMPQALKSGQIVAAPPAEVVGQGLDAVQTAIDTWKKGVSAKKIVVEL